jgi:Xaa-Pro dipeptidase
MTSSGKSILVPWDFNLAELVATADSFIPYTQFNRNFLSAVENLAGEHLGIEPVVEVGSATPVPRFKEIESALTGTVLCRAEGVDGYIASLREIKDETEISIIRKGMEITNRILDRLGGLFEERAALSEIDAAMYIESESRQLGGDGPGFPTIAAGPSRSFSIHAVPNYTGGEFASRGLSILDFGVLYEGYTTDVTCTVLRGEGTDKQSEMVQLVEKAYETARSALKPGKRVKDLSGEVEELFTRSGYQMPHSLGHGIGLAAHESPIVKSSAGEGEVLKPGMVITIEPGLYEAGEGGVRLENDFLITADGAEELTSSRIYTLPPV